MLDTQIPDQKCIKCESPAIFAPAQSASAPFCRSCYEESVKSKFRSTLGRTKLFRNNKKPDSDPVKVLIIFEWDARAKILLQLIDEISNPKNEKTYIRLIPTIYAVHTNKDGKDLSPTTFGDFTINNVHLSCILKESPGGDFGLTEKLDAYRKLFDAVPSSIESEIKRLMFDLLAWKLAVKLDLNIVITAENSEMIAQKSMTTLWFGRSTSVFELSNILDERHPDVKIIRPLRDINNAVIEFLNEPDETTKISNFGDSISSNFLVNVADNGFPAIVTTVLSVSSKLASHSIETLENLSLNDTHCSLCQKACSEKMCEPCQRLFAQINAEKRKIILDILGL